MSPTHSLFSFSNPPLLLLHLRGSGVWLLQELWLISGQVPQVLLLLHLVRLLSQLSFSFPSSDLNDTLFLPFLPSLTPSQLLLIPLLEPVPALSLKCFFLRLMRSIADSNPNQVIRSPGRLILILMLLQESAFTVCFWVKYSVRLYCLMRAANLSGVKLWNCWVTQSLGVWLTHLWPAVIAGKKALSPPLNPGSYCLCKRNITVIEHFPSLPKCTVSITCKRHYIFGRYALYSELQQLQSASPLLPLQAVISQEAGPLYSLGIYDEW